MDHNTRSKKSSVVIVPGLGGSVLEATWTSTSKSHWYLGGTWKQIWPSVDAALPYERGCWKRTIQTMVSSDGRSIQNADPEGISIRPRNFGGLKGVSTLYEIDWKIFDIHIVDYFREAIEFLQGNGVFEIHGAPYDFRLVPDPKALERYFSQLKKLIESCSFSVTLIAHSLGTALVTIFLHRQSKEWKQRYIQRYISVSGPYGGATKAIHACLTGDTETPISISTEFYRQIEVGFGGVLWMINNPEVFKDLNIVNDMNANQLGVALSRKGAIASALAYENLVRPLHKEMLFYPEVDTYNIYGTGIKTPLRLNYTSKDFSDSPHIENGDGDGTVPLQSLQAIHHWPTKDEYPIFKASHLHILKHPDFLKALGEIFGF